MGFMPHKINVGASNGALYTAKFIAQASYRLNCLFLLRLFLCKNSALEILSCL